MGRPVSQTIQNLLDLDACDTQSTLELRLKNGAIIRSATREIIADGQSYKDDLLKTGEIVQSAFSNVDRTNSQMSNVDKQIGLKILNGSIDKAEAIVGRYYADKSDASKNAWVELFRGEAKPTEVGITDAAIEIVDDLVAAGYCVANQTLEPQCPLVFKGFECGYTGDAPPCSHNLATCRILYRFGGMEAKEDPVSSSLPDTIGGGLGSGGGTGGGSGGGTCFVAGTLIDTPSGTLPIEKIRTRDKIYSFNPETLRIEIDTVSQALEHVANGYFELIFADKKQISVTPEHPFLTAINEFTAAGNLAVGQKVFVRSNGELLLETKLEKRHWVGARARVYNFRVARNHTYFANGFAVHNRKEDIDLFRDYQ